MENRNRTVLVVLIAIVIAVAVFSSFGLNLFGTTPEVHFPDAAPSGTSDPNQGSETAEPEHIVRVEVTPETVQAVIETLSRPESYYREVTVATYRADGTEDALTSRVWVSGGWTRTETTLPGGETQVTLVGDGTVYRWYSGDREALSWPADDRSDDIEGQRILTYEDVLALAQENITAAGYEDRNGQSCVYVEASGGELGYVERYWVSVSTGLLVEAEMLEGERVFYRMTAGALDQAPGLEGRFALPDGTVLYGT